MSGSDYDVIVVGLGAMGSSAAYQLARRGQRVLGIEQFTPAHPFGSSHGGSRIVRKAYFEKPDYVPLLVRSYQLWDELSATFGDQLFTRCGALMIGRPDSPVVAGTLESARRWNLPHELLDPAAMRARFGQFQLPEDQLAVFEADAGFVRPEAAVLANLELAADAGAELWFDTVVESVELGPGGVHLSADGEALQAPRVVIATGAWADRLANLDRFPLSVQRQTVHWFTPSVLADFAPERFPVYIWDVPVPAGEPVAELYGFPYLDGETDVKAALYHDGSPAGVDPDSLDRSIHEADHARVSDLLAATIPGLAGAVTRSEVCMYPGASDDDFVLGLHPGSSGRVVLALGFSGHGFKFVPVVGEIVADLVIEGATRHDIGFLSPQRF
ncbi:MAG: N-methyl-L-tryptophan oxidase [Actinomycetota bacterium]|nr:N-methyl-L-tryptophan oxidase [Actinomycetota bacterium]MDQ2956760.1 N-methyl-L-tryptophan oxidase [Actinomycetota bacterium]